MGTNFHFLSNSLYAVVCLVMGSSFLSLPVPKKEGLNSYRISLKVLAIAYFTMGLLTIAILAFNLADNSREYFTFISVLVSSSQALLFTFTLITLINPQFVKLKNVIFHTIPYIVFTLLYSISVVVFGDPVLSSFEHVWSYIDNPTIWIRLMFLGYFLFQLIYYTYLFLLEVRKYDDELMDYFSEVFQLKMGWVRVAFFSALFVGVMAMVSNFFPMKYDWIFTFCFAIFYFGYAQEYIKYNKLFTIIEPALKVQVVEPSIVQPRIVIKTDWEHFKQRILLQKYYREQGITIEDIASKLNVGRTTLSNLINREEGVNFNAWINRLRIEDAKSLLIENPDYSIATISELVGYTEQANFSRQFKQITGESPLAWRKKMVS